MSGAAELTWPPASHNDRTLYLRAGGRLEDSSRRWRASSQPFYVSDPAARAPTWASPRGVQPTMVADQRFCRDARPDVLVFEGPALERDLSVAGPLRVRLVMASTGTDADFVVRLIDVHPMTVTTPCPALRLAPRAVTGPRPHHAAAGNWCARLAAAQPATGSTSRAAGAGPARDSGQIRAARHPPPSGAFQLMVQIQSWLVPADRTQPGASSADGLSWRFSASHQTVFHTGANLVHQPQGR